MSSPWLRTSEDVAHRFAAFAGRALALDSESDSLHHHREKVCLVQVAEESGRAWLIDTLERPDLSPLARIVADPAVVKVLHGADYDVVTLKRDFGFQFANLFDTMLAARLLGLPEVGLQALARAELGVELSKASQRDDWSRRPLSPAQEAYALADVRHLLELHERLSARLREQGRLAWLAEECEAVAALPPSRRREAHDYQRVKGARALAPRQLAALRELYAWREEQAERTDVPAFRILGNEPLLGLAQGLPRDLRHLERLRTQSAPLRGLPPRVVREHAPALLAAVARALELPEAELPRFPPAPPRPAFDPAVRRREDALKAWRKDEAARLGVDVSVVLPQRLLEKVAEAAPRRIEELAAIEGLRRWRVAEFGPALLRLGSA